MAADSRVSNSGLIPALAVGAIVMALYLVPARVETRLPEQYHIAEGTTFRIGNFRYVPDRTWSEDRGRSDRQTISTLTNGVVTFRVIDLEIARSPEEAYAKAADQVRRRNMELGVAVSDGRPMTTRSGLSGLRGELTTPAGTGVLAAFAADAGGVAVWTDVPDDPGLTPEAKADIEAMISSMERTQ